MADPGALVGPPLVVVFNLGAGHGQADTVRDTLQRGCQAAGRVLQLLSVDDPQQLGPIARQAVSQAQAKRAPGLAQSCAS